MTLLTVRLLSSQTCRHWQASCSYLPRLVLALLVSFLVLLVVSLLLLCSALLMAENSRMFRITFIRRMEDGVVQICAILHGVLTISSDIGRFEQYRKVIERCKI